jgi:hypothetical protein
MDPAILRTTLERALKRSDEYVWLYSEKLNWNAPGEVTQDWVDAVNGARAAAATVPAEPAPWITITNPVNRTVFSKPDPIILDANASSPNRTLTKVEFFKGATKVGESLRPPFSCLWSNPPAGTHRITAKATDDTGTTTVSSPITVTVRTAFATRINFQAAGVSPAVSYFIDAGDRYGPRDHGLTYGWNVSHQLNARHRTTGNIDLHLATLCQMQSGGTWEIAVPNGSYSVTVGIGDSDYASTYTINVEGVDFWAAQSQPAGHFVRRTHTVKVNDGKLTLDQGSGGFESTRINYISITGHGGAVRH